MVKGQIKEVERRQGGKPKVFLPYPTFSQWFRHCFLLGAWALISIFGNTSKKCLRERLKSCSPTMGNSFIKLSLKWCRRSAVMRGAILHRLGLNCVKKRLLRRHYGVTLSPPFEEGHHPKSRRFMDRVLGVPRCEGVMCWLAAKVSP